MRGWGVTGVGILRLSSLKRRGQVLVTDDEFGPGI